MYHITKAEYPYLWDVLAAVWEDNVGWELEVPTDFEMHTTHPTWSLPAINAELSTLTKEQVEIMAYGEYEEREQFIKSNPRYEIANELIEAFFVELCCG